MDKVWENDNNLVRLDQMYPKTQNVILLGSWDC